MCTARFPLWEVPLWREVFGRLLWSSAHLPEGRFGPGYDSASRPTGSPPACRPFARALPPFTPVEIGRSLLVGAAKRHSHPARVSTPKSSCGARARQSELDSLNLVAV